MLSQEPSPKGPTCREQTSLSPLHRAVPLRIHRHDSHLQRRLLAHLFTMHCRACLLPSCSYLVKKCDFLRKWKLLIPWVSMGSYSHKCKKVEITSWKTWTIMSLKDQQIQELSHLLCRFKNTLSHENHTLRSLLWHSGISLSQMLWQPHLCRVVTLIRHPLCQKLWPISSKLPQNLKPHIPCSCRWSFPKPTAV